MVAECIIHEDTDSLLGLSLAGMSDANLTSSAGQCYQVSSYFFNFVSLFIILL